MLHALLLCAGAAGYRFAVEIFQAIRSQVTFSSVQKFQVCASKTPHSVLSSDHPSDVHSLQAPESQNDEYVRSVWWPITRSGLLWQSSCYDSQLWSALHQGGKPKLVSTGLLGKIGILETTSNRSAAGPNTARGGWDIPSWNNGNQEEKSWRIVQTCIKLDQTVLTPGKLNFCIWWLRWDTSVRPKKSKKMHFTPWKKLDLFFCKNDHFEIKGF